MKKRFNVNGACIPDIHYMVKIDERLKNIEKLIDDGEYFTINRARQFGKTTTLMCLEKYLSEKYIILSMSFEGVDGGVFASETEFCRHFLKLLYTSMDYGKKSGVALEVVKECEDKLKNTECGFGFWELSVLISKLCSTADDPVVLMIDEVDQAGGYERFLTFLGMLRNKYLMRMKERTFHSVILSGVYDVKNLKLKIRKDESHRYNSPWNIAADFTLDMSFSARDIEGMLKDYESDNHTGMDIRNTASLIYEYTSGYPYLVSRICKLIDEQGEQKESETEKWSRNGIVKAVDILLKEPNTLFDDMIKQLAEYPEISRIIQNMLFEGAEYPFNSYSASMNLGLMFGYIKNKNGVAAISNRIFEMHLYQYYLSEELVKNDELNSYGIRKNQFIQNGYLDMDIVMKKFSQYYTELYRETDERFVEKQGRKLFLLFLKPIINGTGNFYVEAETRNETRTDIVVDYMGKQFIIELKIWKGEKYNADGEKQLIEYLNLYHLDRGYLLTFNFNKNKQAGIKEVFIQDKRILETIV